MKIYAFAALILIYLMLIAIIFPFTVDDAYITYTYARNILRGKGPVFNSGERVEGFTSPLHILALLAFPHERAIIPAGKLIGIISGLALILYLYRRTDNNWLIAVLVAMPSFTISSVNGMETMLFTALLSIFLLSRFICISRAMSMFLIPFLVFARPEGAFIVLCALITDYLFKRNRGYFLNSMAIFIISSLTLFILRFLLYGEFLPNTYFAKAGGIMDMHRIAGGFLYILKFGIKTGFIPFLLFGIHILKGIKNPVGYRDKWPLIIMVLVYFAVIIYEGGDWIPFSRFIIPIVPVLFFLAFDGLPADRKGVGIIILFLTLQVIVGAYEFSYVKGRQKGYDHAHRYIAEYIKANFPKDTRVALMDIGIIKYYSGNPVFDIIGLTNKYAARDPDNLTNHIRDFNPHILVLVSSSSLKDGFSSPFKRDQVIYDSIVQNGEYKFLLERNHFRYLQGIRIIRFYRRLFRPLSSEGHLEGYYLAVFLKTGGS